MVMRCGRRVMIEIGSCSWTEKTLIRSGEFYVKGIRTAEERLRYYAERFTTVEVDSTYYAMPSPGTSALWAERTSQNFIFHIKVYGALTGHGVDPRTVPGDVLRVLPGGEHHRGKVYIKDPSLLRVLAERFIESLDPLIRSDKIGIMVFQFPQWFHYKAAHLDYIATCKEMMHGIPMGVEFRHGSWLTSQRRETVFSFLRENRITYITADEPQFGNLATVPFIPEVTTKTAYLRLHGRNRGNWLRKGIETSLRYDYLYSDDELREFIPPVLGLDRRSEKTYVMFNNCNGGSAMKNGMRLKEFMKKEGIR